MGVLVKKGKPKKELISNHEYGLGYTWPHLFLWVCQAKMSKMLIRPKSILHKQGGHGKEWNENKREKTLS